MKWKRKSQNVRWSKRDRLKTETNNISFKEKWINQLRCSRPTKRRKLERPTDGKVIVICVHDNGTIRMQKGAV